MDLFRSPICGGESGDPCNEHNGAHQAVLYPPSYFRTADAAGPAEGEESVPVVVAATSPASTYVVSRHASPSPLQHRDTCSEQEDIAALRRENESLRSQLQAVAFSASSNAAMHHPCISQCPPAVLTSDLLQVERSLQSRVVQLESEGRRLAEQLAESQMSLREERASRTRDRDNLVAQHRAELEQVTSDRSEAEEGWRRECEEWRVRVGRAEEGERERMDELRLAEQKLACVTREKTEVYGQLEQERSAHTEEVASLELQLTAVTDQNEKLQGELEAARQCVRRLESYLGGELPEEGLTWRDERTALLTRILEMEGERERGERETRLMAVRLAAISEILSLQETALQGKEGVCAVGKARAEEIGSPPKEAGDGEGDVATEGGGGGGEGGLKSLLTLWREKVFALLVQARLTQMQHEQELINTQARVSALAAEVGERQRERDLVTHTLTDRTAQLQLLTTQNEELGRCVQRAEEGWMASQTAADGLSEGLHLALTGVGERWARLKSCLDGCLSRLANYHQRVGVATGRVVALKALVGSQMVLGGGKITRDNPPRGDYVIAERYDVTTQTEPSEKAQDLTKLPVEVLVEEVVSLTRERDSLSRQLAYSTLSLQQLTASAAERQEVLEESCTALTAANSSLREELEGARVDFETVRSELEGHREREAQLLSAQASLQTCIDEAVMEERRRGRELLNEAQASLEVARREQTKTALQLQRSQRKLEEERAGAVETAEVARQGLEEELQRCRDRLRAVQVERNLLLTTLRQEGIKVPPRKPPLKLQLKPSGEEVCHLQQTAGAHQNIPVTTNTGAQEPFIPAASHLYPSTEAVENGHSVTDCPSRYPPSPSPPTSATNRGSTHDSGDSGDGCETGDRGENGEGGEGADVKVLEIQETIIIGGTSPASHLTGSRNYDSSEEDIQNVLKELQLLSTALLDMNVAK